MTLHVGALLAFLGFGFQEILLVAFVALLVFGGNLPDVMRQLGRTYGKFRQSLNELSQPVREEMRQVREVSPPERTPASYAEDAPDVDDASPDPTEGQPESTADPSEAQPGERPDDSPGGGGIPRGGLPPTGSDADDRARDDEDDDEPPPV